MFSVLKTFLRRAGAELPEDRIVRGLPVTLINTRPDIDSEHVFARLDASLALIERYQPWHFRRLARDFARIQVRRFPCRGAYFPDTRICLVELTFVVNPEFTPTQVAATILHEAMHARLDNAGVKYETTSAAKHERFCRRAEVEFGMVAPDGAPVVDRALASLGLVHLLVQDDRLHDLEADGVDRAQRGHRLLEHHGDLGAANRSDSRAPCVEIG